MGKISLLIIFVLCIHKLHAQLPKYEVKDVDQNWISLNDLNGEKFTVLDFWATWCKPCVTSIPKINSLYQEFSESGIEFIGVNIDSPRNQAKVKPFIRSLNVEYPIILDPDQELVREFNITVFPSLVVLNIHGDEVYIHEGYNAGDEFVIQNELKKLLGNAE